MTQWLKNRKLLIYQVSVGDPSELYKHCNASVKAYAEAHGIDYKKQTTMKLCINPDPFTGNRSKNSCRLGGLPVFEKENAFAYLKDYDAVAIIDSDVYIRPDTKLNIFDEVDPEQYDFGGVVERDMPITNKYREKIINYSRMQYSSLRMVDWKWTMSGAEFMNMGIMVMNKSFMKYLDGQTPKEFICRDEFKDFVDGIGAWKWSTDQTLLNYFIKREKIRVKQLGFEWNALFSAVKHDRIKEAHFIHFFLKDHLPNKGEDVKSLMKQI
jgi:hypothetical protein